MGMAAVLCAGADVWLNNPIRPQEASGTSGMKAALNGGLNLSISDGWWDELYDGHDGWTIPTADGVGDDTRRDDLEAAALYDLVEKRVAPLFYRRGESGRPDGWVDTVRHTLAYLGPRVQATRMVRDYVTGYYGPASVFSRAVTSDLTVAKGLAAWKEQVQGGVAERSGDQCRHVRYRHRTVAWQRDDRSRLRRTRWAGPSGRGGAVRHGSG